MRPVLTHVVPTRGSSVLCIGQGIGDGRSRLGRFRFILNAYRVGKALTLNGEITQQYGNGATPSGFGGNRFAFFHRRIEFRVGSKLQLVHDLPREPWRLEHLNRSEEHTSELQSLMRISYAVFGLQKKHNKMKT